MGLHFKGLKFALPPGDQEVLEAFRKNLQGSIQAAGGEIFEWSEASSTAFTHVVVNHAGERHALEGQKLGQQIVSLLWLLESVNSCRLLPAENEVLYSAQYKPLPPNTDLVVATTGYTGIAKVVYGKMMGTLGLTYTKAMNPKVTKIVISTNVTDTSSAKVNAARENGIPVVSVLWLYDCLRQGTILPADRFTSNPAADMDPYKGALAMDAGVQVVANSDESEDGTNASQPETASKSPASAPPALPPAARTQEEEEHPEQAGKDMIMARFEEGLGEQLGVAGSPHAGESAGGVQEGMTRGGRAERTPAVAAMHTTPGAPASNRSTSQPRPSSRFVPPRLAAEPSTSHKTPAGEVGVGLSRAAGSGSAKPGWRPAEPAASTGRSPGSGRTQAHPRSRDPEKAPAHTLVDEVDARGQEGEVSPEILAAGEGAAPPAAAQAASDMQDSYADISQQVRAANGIVGMLLGEDPPAEGDDTEDDLEPGEAAVDSPDTKQAGGGPGSMKLSGKSKVPSAASGDPGRGEGQQREGRIPVNVAAPLASQQYHEQGGSGGEEEEQPLLPSQNRGRPADGAVLWKALPMGRSRKGSGKSNAQASRASKPSVGVSRLERAAKRKSEEAALDPLLGRTVQRKLQQNTFKGTVQSFDQDKGYYRVVYEDDDSEEMSASEVHRQLDTAASAAASPTPPPDPASRPLAPAARQENEREPPPASGSGKAGRKRKAAAKTKAAARGSAEAGAKKGRAAGAKAAATRQVEGDEGDSGDENDSPPAAAATTPAGATDQAQPRSGNPPPRSTPNPPASAARRFDKRPVFTVSGMHSDARERVAVALRGLAAGSSIDLASHQWNPRCTHVLLAAAWIRGTKVLAAMASGAWLLSESYLSACSKAHRLLEEDDYEIEGNKRNTVSKGAPKHWRLRKKLSGRGAFQGLKAVVHGDLGENVRPRRDEVVSILTAGGATILTLSQALTVGAHFCVTRANRPAADPKLKQLQAAGLCIVSPAFVVEWVAHPWTSPARCVVYKSKMGGELTAAASARGEVGAADRATPEGMPAPKPRVVARPPPATEVDEESQLY